MFNILCKEEDMTSYFPPHNKEAARVKDAFPLDGSGLKYFMIIIFSNILNFI